MNEREKRESVRERGRVGEKERDCEGKRKKDREREKSR